MPLLAQWEGKKAEEAVRGEKDEIWTVAFDVTRRPADLNSGSDPFQLARFFTSCYFFVFFFFFFFLSATVQ